MKTNIKTLKDTSADKSKWISAAERLPEPGIPVAVFTSGGKIHVLALAETHTRATRDENGDWAIAWFVPVQNGGKRSGEKHYQNQITHWLSFPPTPLKVIMSSEAA